MFLSLIKFCKDAFEISPLAFTMLTQVDESFLTTTFTAIVNGPLTLPGLKQSAGRGGVTNCILRLASFIRA